MKIFGQNIKEIFSQLPWQYKIVVGASSLFILYTIVYIPYVYLYLHLKPKVTVSTAMEVVTGDLGQYGMLDPSLAASPDGQLWLAFTSQEKPPFADAHGKNTLSVRLATVKPGTKECRSWEVKVAGSIEAKNDSILAPDGQTVLRTGAWRAETPALVYDPEDVGKEWKLFAYKYFWADDPKDVMPVARHYGAIVYKYSSNPAKEWSPEQWLFSPAPNYPPPPYQQTVLLHLNQLDPSLNNVLSYARPSVVYKDHALVMTLSAFTGGVTPDRIIMIASLDHGNSWRYLGAMLTPADVAAIDVNARLAGATLMQQDGKVYLAAVLGNEVQRGQGTFILGFDDLFKAQLQRDPKTNAPAILHQIPLQAPGVGTGLLGGGAAAYDDACKAGMLVTSQSGTTESFKIYNTYFKPVTTKKGEK